MSCEKTDFDIGGGDVVAQLVERRLLIMLICDISAPTIRRMTSLMWDNDNDND